MIADDQIDAAVGEPKGVDSSTDLLAHWERLRLRYNVILTIETLLLAAPFGPTMLGDPEFWALAICGALVANLCYCVGPVVDGYLHRAGMSGGRSTKILFVLGLAFSMVSALVLMMFAALAQLKMSN